MAKRKLVLLLVCIFVIGLASAWNFENLKKWNFETGVTAEDTYNNYTNVTNGSSFNLSNNNLLNVTNDGTKTTFMGTTGDYNRIGDAGVTSHSLNNEDSLLITGKFEVDGNSYFDGTNYISGDWYSTASTHFYWDSADVSFGYRATKGNFVFNTGAGNKMLLASNHAWEKDWDHASQTNPTLFIQSQTNPDTDNTQWLSLTHDQTDGVISTGKGNLYLNPISSLVYANGNVSATGFITRTSIFDKSKSAFDYIKDASYYKDKNKIDHSKFYGYVNNIPVTDYSKPVKEKYVEEECDKIFKESEVRVQEECIVDSLNKIKCTNITYTNPVYDNKNCNKVIKERTIYPYTKKEEGVELGAEIDVLRQGLYELNERVKYLEANCIIK